jgi:hypothetical protein
MYVRVHFRYRLTLMHLYHLVRIVVLLFAVWRRSSLNKYGSEFYPRNLKKRSELMLAYICLELLIYLYVAVYVNRSCVLVSYPVFDIHSYNTARRVFQSINLFCTLLLGFRSLEYILLAITFSCLYNNRIYLLCVSSFFYRSHKELAEMGCSCGVMCNVP